MGHRTPIQAATAVASRQFGAITRSQASSAGLTIDQLRTLVRHGTWRRVMRGLYLVAGAPDSPSQRAMLAWLATRPGDGVLSHVTAAWCDGLLPPSPLPWVTVRPDAGHDCPLARIRRSRVPYEDRRHRDGMTVTTTSRTLVDLAAVLERPAYEEIVDSAFCRKLSAAPAVLAALDRAGAVPAAPTIRDVVAIWTPEIQPDSVAEARLVRALTGLGLTGVVTQYVVRDESGAFVARLDVAVPERRFALEYDSVRYHSPRAWARDEARYAKLRALGWWVEPVTKLDLLPGEPRLAELVAAVLAGSGGVGLALGLAR